MARDGGSALSFSLSLSLSSYLLVLQHSGRHVERALERPDLFGDVPVLALVVAGERGEERRWGQRRAKEKSRLGGGAADARSFPCVNKQHCRNTPRPMTGSDSCEGRLKSLLYAPRRSCGRGVPAVSQARAQRGAAHAHFARPRRPHQKAITSAPRTRGACPRARPGRGLRVFAWLASVQRAARPTRPHPFSKTGNAREGAFSLSLNPEKARPRVVASPFPMPSFFYSPPQRVAHQARVFHGLQGHDRDGHVQADALAI